MSNTKTEAQRLADAEPIQCAEYSIWEQRVRTELRRLDAVEAENHQLREQVEELKGWLKAKSGLGEAVSALRNKLHVQLPAQLAKAVADEREACALECESRQANGNRTHTHPDECAAAIRARSNT